MGPTSIRQVAESRLGPGVASRKRIAAHVAALQRMGAVEALGKGPAARWQLTPTTFDLLGCWLDAICSPALVWRPQPWPNLRDPTIITAYIDQLLAATRSGVTAFASFPRVGRLFQMSAGHALLMELTLASGARPDHPFRFQRNLLANSWRVSRGHIADMLRELRVDGSLMAPSHTELVVTAPFAAEMRGWAAANFALANAALDGQVLTLLEPA